MTDLIRFDVDNLPVASRRMDEAETVFLSEQLEQIDERLYEQKFAPLDGDKLVPMTGNLDPDAETVSYKLRRSSGEAGYINDTPTDVPSVDQAIEKEFKRVVTGAIGFRLSDRDVRKARRADINLDMGGDMACMRALNELRNKSILFGNKPHKLDGFFGDNSVPMTQAASAITTTSSPDDDLAVLNAWTNQIPERTDGIEVPNRWLLPLSTYNVLTSKARSSTSDTTVLQFWAANNEYVAAAGGTSAVMSAPNFDKDLLGAGQGAVGVALNFSPINVDMKVIPPGRFKVIPHGAFGYYVIYTMTHSDVLIRYPEAAHILTKIGG